MESKLPFAMLLLLHNVNTMSCYCLLPFCNNALTLFYFLNIIVYLSVIFACFLFYFSLCFFSLFVCVCVLLSLLKYFMLGLGFLRNGNSCNLHSIFIHTHTQISKHTKRNERASEQTKQNKTKQKRIASRVKTANWISEFVANPIGRFCIICYAIWNVCVCVCHFD